MSVSQEKVESKPVQEASSGKRFPIVVIAIIALAAIAGSVWFFFLRGEKVDDGKLMVSGRIEGYETDIGAKVGGKVKAVYFREGNQVKKGELVAEIEDSDIQAQLRAAQSRTEAARSMERQRQESLDIVSSQIEQGKLQLNRSTEEVKARIDQNVASEAQAQAELTQAEARLREAEANLELAGKRKERFEKLLKPGAVTRDEYDEALKNFDSASAVVASQKAFLNASKKKLIAAKALLNQARADRFNPDIRVTEVNVLKRQFVQARHQLENARHEVEASIAREEEIKANIDYLNLVSPIDGIVTARPVEPGTVVGVGARLLTLIDLDKVYLRGFVPEAQIGMIRVGDTAKIFLDSFPDKSFEGEVIEIDPVASFTPQNIYFKEDRVKQVFGIKIGVKSPGRFAKPGMPADANIILGPLRNKGESK